MRNQQYFCSVPVPELWGGLTRAAVLDAARWDVNILNIQFLDGSPVLHDRVLAAARQWVGPGMGHVRLVNDPASPADIRITFTPGLGSWSYLGIQAQQVNAAEATMNFGWITPQSTQQKLEQVVLHEFGHALGLIHEHQNPQQPINWDIQAVLKDQSGPPNNWSPEQVRSNIFAKYEPDALTGTDLDPQSIMMYPIPAHWTLDGFNVGFNETLSAVDRSFIATAYPW